MLRSALRFSPELSHLVARLLAVDPAERIDLADALQEEARKTSLENIFTLQYYIMISNHLISK